MKTNKKAQEKHHREIVKIVKSMKFEGYNIIGSRKRVFYRGNEVDLSATNPDPLSIAYTTLKQIYG